MRRGTTHGAPGWQYRTHVAVAALERVLRRGGAGRARLVVYR